MTGGVFFCFMHLLLILYLIVSCNVFLYCFSSIICATCCVVICFLRSFGSCISSGNVSGMVTCGCNLLLLVFSGCGYGCGDRVVDDFLFRRKLA